MHNGENPRHRSRHEIDRQTPRILEQQDMRRIIAQLLDIVTRNGIQIPRSLHAQIELTVPEALQDIEFIRYVPRLSSITSHGLERYSGPGTQDPLIDTATTAQPGVQEAGLSPVIELPTDYSLNQDQNHHNLLSDIPCDDWGEFSNYEDDQSARYSLMDESLY